VGAATQKFAPGGKYHRAATADLPTGLRIFSLDQSHPVMGTFNYAVVSTYLYFHCDSQQSIALFRAI